MKRQSPWTNTKDRSVMKVDLLLLLLFLLSESMFIIVTRLVWRVDLKHVEWKQMLQLWEQGHFARECANNSEPWQLRFDGFEKSNGIDWYLFIMYFFLYFNLLFLFRVFFRRAESFIEIVCGFCLWCEWESYLLIYVYRWQFGNLSKGFAFFFWIDELGISYIYYYASSVYVQFYWSDGLVLLESLNEMCILGSVINIGLSSLMTI